MMLTMRYEVERGVIQIVGRRGWQVGRKRSWHLITLGTVARPFDCAKWSWLFNCDPWLFVCNKWGGKVAFRNTRFGTVDQTPRPKFQKVAGKIFVKWISCERWG
jgi:hypothetical protein